MTEIILSVDMCPHGLQISIDQKDADGGGHGYRIAGPKYTGYSKSLLRHTLTKADARAIQQYLNKVAK